MQEFIEVKCVTDDAIAMLNAAADADVSGHIGPMLVAVSKIYCVTPSTTPGVSVVSTRTSNIGVIGIVADIAAKIADAQAAPAHPDPALFGRPRIGIEGTGGVSFVRVCDITSIRPCQSGAARSIVYTRHHGAIASALESEAVERLISEARSAWYGKGAA